MTQAHTPGEWKLGSNWLEFGGTGNDGSIPIVADEYGIADVRLTKQFPRGRAYKAVDPERDANARLIAASPDLLAALQDILGINGFPKRDEWLDEKSFEAAKAAHANARAAIAKATGAAS